VAVASVQPIGLRRTNGVLSALAQDDRRRLEPHLEPVHLPRRKILHEPGVTTRHVFFPLDGVVVSLLALTVDGHAAEVAAIGHDGLVGLAAVFPSRTAGYQSLVQLPGDAYRLRAEVFQSEFERAGSFRLAVLLHLHALLDQIVQSGACNRFHTTRQRLCRWLLMSQDRVQSHTFSLTQEFIALTLGADRKRVSAAATALQDAGVIRQRHGTITILNRRGLEACACECYQAVTGRTVDQQTPAAGQHAAPHRRPALM
jgi:CRP-like cAMP-binding protein